MRCDQVIRELAVPSDDRDATALASHIASCPACAAWANRAVQFDRLWQATRPSEPTPDAWDTVWTNLAASLDPSTSSQVAAIAPQIASSNGSTRILEFPAGKQLRPSSGSRSLIFLTIGLAQAAAIFLAVSLTGPRFNPSQIPQISRTVDLTSSPPRSEPVVEIDEGRQVVIVINAEGQAPKVIDRTPEDGAFGVDDCVMYNTMESIRISVVAMKE